MLVKAKNIASRAFTMLEVTIAILILTVGLLAALSTTSSMHLDSEGLRQQELAHLIARSVVEHIQAARWSELGNREEFLQRRRTPVPIPGRLAAVNPPLDGTALVNLKFLATRPQLDGLAVHVEYYRMCLLDRMNELTQTQRVAPLQAWRRLVGNEVTGKPPTDDDATCWMIFPEESTSVNTFDPDERLKPDKIPVPGISTVKPKLDDGMMVRVLVGWIPAGMGNPDAATTTHRVWTELVAGIRKS